MPHFGWHRPAAGKTLATPLFDNKPSGPGRRWCCRWWWAGWAGGSGGWRGRRAGQVASAQWAQGGRKSPGVRRWSCTFHHLATRGNQSAPARSKPPPSSGRAQSGEGCGASDRPSQPPEEGQEANEFKSKRLKKKFRKKNNSIFLRFSYNWCKSESDA